MSYVLFVVLILFTVAAQSAWWESERDHPGASAGKFLAIGLMGVTFFVIYTYFHEAQVRSFFYKLWG